MHFSTVMLQTKCLTVCSIHEKITLALIVSDLTEVMNGVLFVNTISFSVAQIMFLSEYIGSYPGADPARGAKSYPHGSCGVGII